MKWDSEALLDLTDFICNMQHGVLAEAEKFAREGQRDQVSREDVDKAVGVCMAGMADPHQGHSTAKK